MKPEIHKEYNRRKNQWQQCRDCYDGSEAIKGRASRGSIKSWPGTAYLPALEGHQSESDYASYRERAQFYNGMGRSVDGLTGMIMAKAPLFDFPEEYSVQLDDLTLDGEPFISFVSGLAEEVLIVGRAGVLIDFPRVEKSTTKEQAEAENFRPYWTIYKAEEIINWRSEWINNQSKIVLVDIADSEDSILRLELIEGLYQQTEWVKQKSGEYEMVDDPVIPLIDGIPLSTIPFRFVNVKKTTTKVDKPPLLDLAYCNIAHYRNSADYEQLIHVCGLPTPWSVMFEPAEDGRFHLGPSTTWNTSQPGAAAGYLEISGQSAAAIQAAMREKEGQMAALGSRVLSPEKRAVETAETAALHRVGELSILSSIAKNLEEVMTWGLRIHARWAGFDGDESEIKATFNTDFMPERLDPALLSALLGAVAQGVFAESALFDYLKRFGFYGDKTTFEDVQAEIATKPPALPTGYEGGGYGGNRFGGGF
jgi:hypothetical protein